MNTEKALRTLRTNSIVVTVFALLLVVTGLVQMGLGGIAVSDEYERIEQLEQLQREQRRTIYGFQGQHDAFQAEYRRSSGAFFSQGRFIPSDERLSLDDPALLTAILFLLAMTGFFAASLAWVWRAHSNLEAVGVRMKFGARKAVAGYLLPVANFILPFEAMRELFNRSHGEGDDFAHSSVDDVNGWWTAVVIGLLIFSAMIMKFMFDAGSALIIMTPLWMEFAILCFAILLLLGGAFLFAALARKITAAQMEVLPELAGAEPVPQTAHGMSVNIITS